MKFDVEDYKTVALVSDKGSKNQQPKKTSFLSGKFVAKNYREVKNYFPDDYPEAQKKKLQSSFLKKISVQSSREVTEHRSVNLLLQRNLKFVDVLVFMIRKIHCSDSGYIPASAFYSPEDFMTRLFVQAIRPP